MRLIGTALTDADGRCAAPLLEGAAFAIGRYSLTFHVAAYFRALGAELPDPPFLDEVVIAFGILISTILGRFVIPIYYVLGERLIDHFARVRGRSHQSHAPVVENHAGRSRPVHEQVPVAVH